MEPTVPDTSKDANFAAKIEADKQIELARINSVTHQMSINRGFAVIAFLLFLVAGLVIASFVTGHLQVATHTITAVGSGVAGWFAGKSKR